MKWYCGIIGLLVVVVVIAIWPKPEEQRQAEQQTTPESDEKKAAVVPSTGASAVEEDVPESTSGMKVTAHRRRAGEPGEDGWYLAESTEGGFSVKLPNIFNDMTLRTKSEAGAPLTMYAVATRINDQIQYTATRGSRKDNKPIAEALEGFVKVQEAGLKEKVAITQAGMQGIQTRAVVGPTAAISRVLVTETTIYMLVVENRAGTNFTLEMERNAPIFFESFRLR